MDIAAHIGELVKEQECVIIPGLGAFLTNYHAADINAQQHLIHPPSRKLVFNAQLKSNDGLLAHYLSERLDLSYKTTLLLLEVFSNYCQRDLAEGKQISFGTLGILDRNNHQKLEFYPNTTVNYNEDSFGLNSIAARQIHRTPDFSLQAPIQKTELKIASTKTVSINRSAIRKIAAVLLPLALFVSVLYYLPNIVKNENIQQSSIFSFLDSLRSTFFLDEKVNLTNENSSQSTIDSIEPEIEQLEETSAEIIEESNTDFEIIVKEDIEKTLQGNYHIICGSFLEKDRAESLVTQLKNQGFAAGIAGQSSSGTYRVSIQSFILAEDASRQISWVRNQGFTQAWVLNKTF